MAVEPVFFRHHDTGFGMTSRLEGRFVLITGASRGIGRAVAELFAEEGATVAINHVRDAAAADHVVEALHSRDAAAHRPRKAHCAVEADVSDESAVKAMVAGLVSTWGRLDGLINNAGIQSGTPGDSFDTSVFERIIAVNLTGAALCAREFIAHALTGHGGGFIINTTSVHEVIPKPGWSAYAAAKAGLGHLTRSLALEYADRGIRVNAVAPGAVLTDINASWALDAEKRAAVESHIPMGYAASPDEIAPLYAFLASADASYVTGQTFTACGGLTLYGDFKNNWSS